MATTDASAPAPAPARSRLVFKTAPKFHPRRMWKMVEAFTDTALVSISPEHGFELQCLSKSQTAMLEWTIAPDGFDTFECSAPVSFGVLVLHMNRLLSSAGPGAEVEWDFSDDTNIQIDVCPSEADVAKGLRAPAHYEMRTVSVDRELVAPREVDWLRVSVRTDQFHRAVSHLYALVEEISQITVYRLHDGSGVQCKSSASSLSGSQVVSAVEVGEGGEGAGGDEGSGGDDEEGETAEASASALAVSSRERKYQGRLLQQVLDAATAVGTYTTLHWFDGCPLCLRFTNDPTSPAGATVCGSVRVFIAPLIGDDDDDE